MKWTNQVFLECPCLYLTLSSELQDWALAHSTLEQTRWAFTEHWGKPGPFLLVPRTNSPRRWDLAEYRSAPRWRAETLIYLTLSSLRPRLPTGSQSFSSVWLCHPMNCRGPGSSVQGIFQARILERIASSYSRGSFPPRDWTLISCVSCIGRWILYHCTTWVARWEVSASVNQFWII